MESQIGILSIFSLSAKRAKSLNKVQFEKLIVERFQLVSIEVQKVSRFHYVFARFPSHLDLLGVREVKLPPLADFSEQG